MKKFYCPVNSYDCPYWKEDNSCAMADEGLDPIKECDDANFYYDDDGECGEDEAE